MASRAACPAGDGNGRSFVRPLIAGAVSVSTLAATAAAQAVPQTVGEMQRACRIVSGEAERTAPEDAISAGACYGAVRGVVQVMQANCRSYAAGQRPARALSVGAIPSAGDAIEAFDAWAEENPGEADAPAEYGIIVALARAFPCAPAVPRAAPSSTDGDGSGTAPAEDEAQ